MTALQTRSQLLLCALLALVLFTVWAYPVHERALSGANDYLQLYAGSKLVGTPQLYSPEAAMQIHREAVGQAYSGVYYSRPPFYAFLLKPLSWMPYRAAYYTFQLLSLAAFLVFAALRVRGHADMLFLVCTSVPVIVNFTSGQDVSLVLCFASLALWAEKKGHSFLAGLLLSLCSIKFHLLLLLPLGLIVQKRWRILAGGVSGGLVLALISFLAAGWRWPLEYLEALRNPGIHPGAEHMPTFRSVLDAAGAGDSGLWFVALGVVTAAAVCWLATRTNSLEEMTGFALAGGLLTAFHAYTQDCAILLLAYSLLAPRVSIAVRAVLLAVVLPPVYFMLLSGPPYNMIIPVCLIIALALAVFRPAKRSAIFPLELSETVVN